MAFLWLSVQRKFPAFYVGKALIRQTTLAMRANKDKKR
jgi:hypothetical protein